MNYAVWREEVPLGTVSKREEEGKEFLDVERLRFLSDMKEKRLYCFRGYSKPSLRGTHPVGEVS
jgi:hypothetical protein